jgi:hypothetical protein
VPSFSCDRLQNLHIPHDIVVEVQVSSFRPGTRFDGWENVLLFFPRLAFTLHRLNANFACFKLYIDTRYTQSIDEQNFCVRETARRRLAMAARDVARITELLELACRTASERAYAELSFT